MLFDIAFDIIMERLIILSYAGMLLHNFSIYWEF